MKTTACLSLVFLLVGTLIVSTVLATESDRKIEPDDARLKQKRDDARTTVTTEPDEAVESRDKAAPESSSSSAAGERINWQVISAGGTNATSTGYALSGTIGQTAAGEANSPTYTVHHGFWQTFSIGCCNFRGDVDRSGAMDLRDIDFFIDWMFRGGATPACEAEADVDGSGQVDLRDIDYFIDYLFRGGPDLLPCP